MTSFNGSAELKKDCCARARSVGAKVAAGGDRKQLYWSRRRWCEAPYVCNTPECNHAYYAEELGVPVAIAYAERGLFVSLDDENAHAWSEFFLKALPVGLDSVCLQKVWRNLALFVLNDRRHGLLSIATTTDESNAIADLIALFETNSKDCDAWKKAATACRQAGFKGPDTNRRLKSADAIKAAGAKAAYAASYFGYAYENPRYAAEALQWSAWAFRYRRYGELVRQFDNVDKLEPDERGMVNVGTAFWAFGRWARSADKCESHGEAMRMQMYRIYGDEFLRLLKRENIGMIGAFANGLRKLVGSATTMLTAEAAR